MGDDDHDRVRELLEQYGDEALLKLRVPLMASSSSSSASFEVAVDNNKHDALFARFQRLKAPPPTPRSSNTNPNATIPNGTIPNVIEPSPAPLNSSSILDDPDEVLDSDLAARLAALKTTGFSKNQPGFPNPNTVGLGSQNHPGSRNPDAPSLAVGNDGDDVEKLLASVADLVRLEKKKSGGSNFSSGYKHSSFRTMEMHHDDDDDDSNSESEVNLIVDWAKDAARLDLESDPEEEEENPKPSL